MKKPKCNAVFNPLRKEARGMEISAAPGVLVGVINARRPAAPKTERRSTTPAAGVRRADAPRARRPRKASPAAPGRTRTNCAAALNSYCGLPRGMIE